MQLKFLITPAQEGGYIGYVPAIPGAFTQAETIAELKENIKEVVALLQETRLALVTSELKDQPIETILL